MIISDHANRQPRIPYRCHRGVSESIPTTLPAEMGFWFYVAESSYRAWRLALLVPICFAPFCFAWLTCPELRASQPR